MGDRQSGSKNDPITAANNDTVNVQIELGASAGAGKRDHMRMAGNPGEAFGRVVDDGEANTSRTANMGKREDAQYPDCRGAKSDTRYVHTYIVVD
jgi:hypothetical protein